MAILNQTYLNLKVELRISNIMPLTDFPGNMKGTDIIIIAPYRLRGMRVVRDKHTITDSNAYKGLWFIEKPHHGMRDGGREPG